MRVIICKFLSEDNIESKVGKLVSREKRKVGDNLRVFSLDKQIQERLGSAGISSELLDVLWRHIDIENELNYEKAYEISDRWHAAVEDNNKLKYHGINFLTLEYNMSLYSRVVEFSQFCHRMIEQKCEVCILVLSQSVSSYTPTINTSSIKTLFYTGRSELMQRLWYLSNIATQMIYSLFRGLGLMAGKLLKKKIEVDSPSDTSRILVLVSSSLYARPAETICKEGLKNGLTPFVGPYDSALMPLFQTCNYEYSKVAHFISLISLFPRVAKILPLFYRLRRHINLLEDTPDGNSNEFSPANLCKEVLSGESSQLCYLAIISIAYLEKIVNLVAPSIICLMPDGYFLQQMAAALAKKYGIPTLACAAALEHGNARIYMRHLHADKIAAMGHRIRETYIASGLAPERAVVTGVAHFDLLFHRNKEQDARLLLEKGIDITKKIIVFATENLSVSETVEALRGVVDATYKLRDVQLVVKVHPSEDPEPYLDEVQRNNDHNIIVGKDIDLYALINHCELFIVKFSTTALEAMMVDKPVVVINLSGKPTPIPYAEEGAALGVYKYNDIESAINKALYDEDTKAKFKAGREKFVRAWAGEPDGKASFRIVNLMKEMITASDKLKRS